MLTIPQKKLIFITFYSKLTEHFIYNFPESVRDGKEAANLLRGFFSTTTSRTWKQAPWSCVIFLCHQLPWIIYSTMYSTGTNALKLHLDVVTAHMLLIFHHVISHHHRNTIIQNVTFWQACLHPNTYLPSCRGLVEINKQFHVWL